ncbi:MAG: hypothetical protein ACKOPU_05670 [Candidatus Planktophila sp.]
MSYDFANDLLNDLYNLGIVSDPMVEPIDEPDCHPLDAAFVMGIEDEVFDEMYPHADMQEMVDENGVVWYVS